MGVQRPLDLPMARILPGCRPLSQLYHLFWTTLDWLYPPRCGGCGMPGSRWCVTCQEATLPLAPPFCEVCGNPGPTMSPCSACQANKPAFEALRSYAPFSGPLQNALHRLKYRKDTALGEALSRPLVDYLRRLNWEIGLVVPVPLGKSRQAERGYNQTALIGLPLALALGLPYRPSGLRRARETRSQVGLDAVERRLNVKAAFEARPEVVQNQVVLILDDVTTTGATLEAAADALIRGGARKVYALTLARTVLSGNPRA